MTRILALCCLALALALGACGTAAPLSAINVPPGFGGNNSGNGGA